METRKLYYEDPHCRRFESAVVSCEETKGGYAVVLEATAFYPEGGGAGVGKELPAGLAVVVSP